MLLIEELRKLAEEAAEAEDYFVAAIITYLCTAIVEGREGELSGLITTWYKVRNSDFRS